LTDLGDENYELDFGKRWKRTGFVDKEGSPTHSICLKHGKENIVWHRSKDEVTKGGVKGEAELKLVLDFVEKWEVVTLGFLKGHAKKTSGLSMNTVGTAADQLVRDGKIYQHLIKITGKSGPAETVYSTFPDEAVAAQELNSRFKASQKKKEKGHSHDSHDLKFD
jgi:hypothetical protein